ncbi:MAG: HEAT repeat domain-containing protein [Planctomycetia bacterium]|nr:HEAT repeat domain-containing protein [Planctomycetia bacterium]
MVRIVSKLGGAASAAVPAIVVRLDDKDSAVRADAIRCLGDIGEPAELIMPALAKKVRDENPEVRSWAILSMLRIKPEPVVRHFGREKLQKPDDAREKQALTRVVATAYESLWPQVQEKNKSADQCKKQLLAADAIVLLSPDNGAYMTMQGLAQLRSRKHKDASTTLVAALAKNGPNPVDNAYLSIVRLRQRDRMGAQQLLTESILLLRKENWSTNADAILAVAEASSTFVKEQRAKGR